MNKDNTPPHNDEQPSDEKRKQTLRQRKIRYALSYLFVALVAVWLIEQFVVMPLMTRQLELPYSEFKAKIKAGQVIDVTLGQGRIAGHLKDPARAAAEPIPFTTIAVPDGDPTLIADLDAAGVAYQAGQTTNNTGRMLLSFLFPLSLLGGVWYFVYSGAGKGGRSGLGGVMGAGKSKAMQVAPEKIGITFQDVGGADEAIAELREITQFLTKPEQFARLGGRIPKGVLLVGPPGTGKTLLAKATAGEANAPFFETSGSEFVEMFVGVGAARVRDLFKQARKAAPAIIFIDEIDAIGQARGGRMRSSGNDEREQTLNQLLSEIDGFRSELSKPIIIIAATNRPEDLDPALLRAGRFDRQVTVSAPDLCGRLQILSIHTRKLDLSPDFDVERAARMTPGFTGADLANAMNEAALLAARRDADAITMQDFEAAIERVVAGLEKKSRLMNELERITVAYHESGHALVAELLPHADPVAKVSIVPRGRGALGYCLQMPVEDRYLLTCEELEDRIAVMLGGRAAELIVRHVVSTGASDDIKRATELARRMVTEFGMSQKLGTVCYATRQYEFLEGAEGASAASPDTLKMIDEEIQRIVEEQYQRAQGLLSEHRDALERLARQLLQTETVDGAGIKEALAA